MSFARKLSALRNRKGITQAELGKRISVTPQAVSKWENGISEPDIATLARIARIFDVTVDYLLSDGDALAENSESPSAVSMVKPVEEVSEEERRHKKRIGLLWLLFVGILVLFVLDLGILFSFMN